MTAGQFRHALRRAGISQAAFARALGISSRHVNRWATGTQETPKWAAAIARLLGRQVITISQLEE